MAARSLGFSASPSTSQNLQQRSPSHPSPLPRTTRSSRQSRCEVVDLDDELNENDAGVYVAAFPYESEGKPQWLLKPVVQMVFVVDLQISTLSSHMGSLL
jgi:hypothetical protein